MSGSDDTIGCVVLAALAAYGGYWAYTNYEIKKVAPVSAKAIAPRATGEIEISRTKEGSVWRVDADSVSGDRRARQGWVTVDATADKSAKFREYKELYQVDCNTTGARILSEVSYDAKGSVLANESRAPGEAEIQYLPPGTRGAKVVSFLCQASFDPSSPSS